MNRGVILASMLALAACGGGSSSSDAGSSAPVSHQPLAGTVNGQPWTAGYATAQDRGDSSGYFVTVYAQGVDAGCYGGSLDVPELLTSVPWTANSAYDFSLQHNLTFSFKDGSGNDQNDVATSGRIELDAAPAFVDTDGGPPTTTTLRIRGKFDANNSVEGQVNVVVCPPF